MDRGYCAIGIINGKFEINIGTLIRSANLFGADMVFTIGKRYDGDASAVGHDEHIPILNFSSVEELKEIIPDATLVGVERPGRDIRTFHHPDKAVYLLGAEDSGIPDENTQDIDRFVEIDTEFPLNVSTAGSVVLYDRSI